MRSNFVWLRIAPQRFASHLAPVTNQSGKVDELDVQNVFGAKTHVPLAPETVKVTQPQVRWGCQTLEGLLASLAPFKMSVFRRGKKLAGGAMHEELSSSSDDDDSEEEKEVDGEEEAGSEGQEEDEEDDVEDSTNVDLGWHYEPEVEVQEEPKGKGRGGDEHDSDSEEDDVREGDEDGDRRERTAADGEVLFPVTCSICEKVLFNEKTAAEHMRSVRHLKNEQRFVQQQRSSKRTTGQIEKLQARNQRKKDRKNQKKQQGNTKTHVWGQHKLPEKGSTGGYGKQQGEHAPANKKRKVDADADEVGFEAASVPKKQLKKVAKVPDADKVDKTKGASPGVKNGGRGSEGQVGTVQRGGKKKK